MPDLKNRRVPLPPAALAVALALVPLAAGADDVQPSSAPDVPVGGPAPAPPTTADVEKRLRELEETIRKQQEIIQQLQQTVETLKKTGPDPAAVQSIVDERLKKQKPVAGPR